MLALIAGEGALPGLVHARLAPDVVVCEMRGFASGLPDPLIFEVERLGSFLKDLKARGVSEVCFAGAVRRPKLDPKRIDARTLPLVPKVMAAIGKGDDAALRAVLAIFEEAGLRIVAAHEVLPDLLLPEGCPTAARPGERDRKDAARAAEILAAMGAVDLGQAVVVAAGQALAVETLGGTDWMLRTLGAERPAGPGGGILFKAPKPGQDRRVDLPVIGPRTVEGAAAAGLNGIVIEAGGVMVLEREAVIGAADEAGLFLWARAR
ncbi:LpxI family protein [Ovoidimarina sediminis]|uniref:LpxI family protein n=1 Tax=Ovoidimarina sediminis TaxID=3079856 RepID=UPI00290D3681|nr:UDP-2,3-diacylglucosamine diphosphatase LpxI [Rhodophyticola sp. MJ-SS7]MDU8941901.1 UDP-2,3-diacylglucosamine diphosphatase LpxI [Rhodophyticola sp. MJ-SS7]